MRWADLFLIVFLFAFSLQNSERESSWHQGPVAWKTVLLPTEGFEAPLLERRFRDSLRAKDPAATVFQIEAMDRPESVSLSGHGYNDISYSLWKLLYSDYENGIPPFAELLAIGDNVGMRVRDNLGRVSLKVLTGENPYDLQACGEQVVIQHLSIRQTGILKDGKLAPPEVSLHFFLVAGGAVNERIAACALEELRKETSASHLYVSLRNDPWFLQESDYPIVSPFLVNPKPPTQEAYERGLEWECSSGSGPARCSGGRRQFQFAPKSGSAGMLPEARLFRYARAAGCL